MKTVEQNYDGKTVEKFDAVKPCFDGVAPDAKVCENLESIDGMLCCRLNRFCRNACLFEREGKVLCLGPY